MPEWKPYTKNEHNYMLFKLNDTHNERNYFDSMYYFWLEVFDIELNGGCYKRLILMKIKQYRKIYLIILCSLFITVALYCLCKCFRKKK